MDAVGVDLDQRQSRRVDALLKPMVEALGPVIGECRLVADQLGLTFDGDDGAGLAEKALLALEGERDVRVGFDFTNFVSIAAAEEEAVAVLGDVAVVRHRPGRQAAVGAAGGQHAEIDIAHGFADIAQILVRHVRLHWFEWGGKRVGTAWEPRLDQRPSRTFRRVRRAPGNRSPTRRNRSGR
jgi:hypothetical protein